MDKYKICASAALIDKSCKEFSFTAGSNTIEGFVVRISADEFYGYENHCPHTGVQLNWQPDQFYDLDYHYLQCGMHGALFQVYDGMCIRGPCLGQSLTALKIVLEAGTLFCEYGQKSDV